MTVPAAALSTRHARFVRVDAGWVVEDAQSRNGTEVNGVRVERAVLGESDVAAMGRVLFLLTPPLLTPAGGSGDRDTAGADGARHVTLDPQFDDALAAVRRVASPRASSAPGMSLLILGETGTGKEVLAREVHTVSGRKGALACVNCGAIPPTLLESLLFGHVKGAFSGASRDEPGLFRSAHEGTVFLDEIGDLSAPSQAALLRVLQEREVLPVGATRHVKVDFRVVAATHRPLEAMVRAGTFREDLLARLSGFSVVLPPLRARPWDIGVLFAALIRKLAGDPGSVRIAPDAGRAILRHGWPQNTRELEQCVARCLALADGETIGHGHLPPAVVALKAPAADPAAAGLSERDARLRLELLAELSRCSGNLADVARAMGKARMQVHRWCRRFGIDPNLYRT